MEELIMRIKDFRSGAERLNDIMSVCEDKKFTEVEASEVIDALAAVRADVFLYVQDWAYKEGKGCEIHLTFPDISFDFPAENGDFSGRELIYLPFMSCSVWLWEKMLQEPENPVFEMVRYFCMCVHYLRYQGCLVTGKQRYSRVNTACKRYCEKISLYGRNHSHYS